MLHFTAIVNAILHDTVSYAQQCSRLHQYTNLASLQPPQLFCNGNASRREHAAVCTSSFIVSPFHSDAEQREVRLCEHTAPGKCTASHQKLICPLSSINHNEAPCSTECAAQNCHNFNIHYGRFCGVGHTGCKGVKPCDSYDACCAEHDHCATSKGVTDLACHTRLTECLSHSLLQHRPTWLETMYNSYKEKGVAVQHKIVDYVEKCSAARIVDAMSKGMNVTMYAIERVNDALASTVASFG